MLTTLFALALSASEPAPAALASDVEEAMALSAAPDSLRPTAGLWRLGPGGYVEVRASHNGFNCLVTRDERQGFAPVCYDAEGSATTLKADLERAQLRAAGRSEADVERQIAADYAAGLLSPPRRAGVAYMLSEHFSDIDPATGRRRCVFPPHVMVYAPGLTNADIGASPADRGSMVRPWVLNEGKPNAYIIFADHQGHHPCD